MKITIEKIVYPGKSLARVDGKVFFTDKGLPGEVVEIEIVRNTKGYSQGKTIEILSSSPERRDVKCQHYHACSPYQYINYSYQIKVKKDQIQEILSRQLKIDLPQIDFRSSPKEWGYRNKVKLKVIWDKKTPKLVYNLPQSLDEFVEVGECFLSPEKTNLFLKSFIKVITKNPLPNACGITVKENSNHELLVVVYYRDDLEVKNAVSIFKNLFTEFCISGFVLINVDRLTKTVIHGEDHFKEIINNVDFYIGAQSFFQVNTDILPVLIKDLEDNLDLDSNKILADLYCGVGVFGILLAPKVKRVMGVESDTENFFFMEKNIRENNIENFDIRLSDCKETIDSLLSQKLDVAIIDPPRKGMDVSICNALVKSGPKSICYISCNPTTLARDLKILVSNYDINRIYGYDFFPNTPHIEAMVVLKRKAL